jgi:hypothetical protein
MIDQVHYTKLHYFTDTTAYCGTQWTYSMNSFVQSSFIIASDIHNCVQQYIKSSFDSDELEYFGIGGESCFYSLLGNFKKITCVTRDHNSIDDYHRNICMRANLYGKSDANHATDFVSYDTIDLAKYDINVKKCILLFNIRKSGFTIQIQNELKKKNDKFKKIIYIGCSSKAVQKDTQCLQLFGYILTNCKQIKLSHTELFYCLEFC